MSFDSPQIHQRTDRHGLRIRRILAALAVLAIVLAAWLYWDNTRVVITHYTVSSEQVTGEPIRIAQISDLHAYEHGAENSDLIAQIRDADPDIVAITGDYVSYNTPQQGIDAMVRLGGELDAVAPVMYVNGNHEVDNPAAERLYSGLEREGVTVLRNEAETLTAHGQAVEVVGVDDPREQRVQGSESDNDEIIAGEISRATDGRRTPRKDVARIVLSHRYDPEKAFAASGADLVLTGHSHGGQVRIPFLGGLISPSRTFFPEHTEGMYAAGESQVIVSRGLGNSAIPVRVNNPFELVIVDLVPSR